MVYRPPLLLKPIAYPFDIKSDCLDANNIKPGQQASCIIVHNTQQLQNHAGVGQGSTTPIDIILNNGIYPADDLTPPLAAFPNQKFLKFSAAHRLWARTPGEAIIHFGIDTGSPSNEARYTGPEFHGLVIDILDPQHAVLNFNSPTAPTIAFSMWGAAKNALIEDLFIIVNKQVNQGIQAVQGDAADGLKIRRTVVNGFDKYGIITQYCRKNSIDNFQCNDQRPEVSMVLEDLVVTDIGGNFDPSNLAESENVAITMGAPGRLSRVRVRDVTRVGIGTQGTMTDGILEDLDVDRIGLGQKFEYGKALYIENTTRNTEFTRFCVGPTVEIGLISEWNHCNAFSNSIALNSDCFWRGLDNTVRDAVISANFIGINFDQGTVRSRIENVTFRNASKTGIVIFNNIDNVQLNNHFDLPPGVCPVSYKHWNANTPCTMITSPDDFINP